MEFTEKPNTEVANKLIEQGALWNCGVFAFKAGFVLDKMTELTGCSTFNELKNMYPELPRISFDNAVVVKSAMQGEKVQVIRYSGEWKDIGTWNSLTGIMDDKLHGNVIIGDECGDINAINELGIPILMVGVDDLIVSATNAGILITRKDKSGSIKKYIDGYY